MTLRAPNSSNMDSLGLPTCQIQMLLDGGWPDVQSPLQNQLSCKLDLQAACFEVVSTRRCLHYKNISYFQVFPYVVLQQPQRNRHKYVKYIHISIHQQTKSCSLSNTVSRKPSNMYSCPSPSSLELTRSYQPKLPNSFGVPKLQPAHKMFRTQIARCMTHFMPYRCQTHRMQQCWHGNVINRQTDSCVWDQVNKKSCRFVWTRDVLEGKTCIILPRNHLTTAIFLARFNKTWIWRILEAFTHGHLKWTFFIL